MHATCLAALLTVTSTACGQTRPAQPDILQDYYRNLPDAKISAAIRSVLDETPQDKLRPGTDFSSVPATQYTAFAKALDQARIPFCLHGDGLKFQPTSLGPIALPALAALPMVAVAAVRGKCKM